MPEDKRFGVKWHTKNGLAGQGKPIHTLPQAATICKIHNAKYRGVIFYEVFQVL